MKKLLIFSIVLLMSTICYASDIDVQPKQADDAKITKLEIQFDDDGNIESIEVYVKLLNSGEVIRVGSKVVTDSVPSAHKTVYENNMGIYLNAIKNRLGL